MNDRSAEISGTYANANKWIDDGKTALTKVKAAHTTDVQAFTDAVADTQSTAFQTADRLKKDLLDEQNGTAVGPLEKMAAERALFEAVVREKAKAFADLARMERTVQME